MLLLLIVLTFWTSNALAHSGRIDKDGCHRVSADYKYESGKVSKQGTRHCHRPIGKMKLDGREMLLEDDSPKNLKAGK